MACGKLSGVLKDSGLYRTDPKLINDQELYRNAKLTLQKVDKATEGLEDQGPLSVMGIIVNNLF